MRKRNRELRDENVRLVELLRSAKLKVAKIEIGFNPSNAIQSNETSSPSLQDLRISQESLLDESAQKRVRVSTCQTVRKRRLAISEVLQ